MSAVGEWCEICHKWLAEWTEQVFATYKGKGVIVCSDCKRQLELGNTDRVRKE